MKLADLFLSQLDVESSNNRRTLERVPEGKNHWKPHEKSMELGYLAALVATMPQWIEFMVNRDELDLRDPGSADIRPKTWSTHSELTGFLDDAVAKARGALSSATDEHLMKPWRFMVGGQVASELPRYVMIRDMVFSHMAHHRGQLTVYLRLSGALVPALYGPSADEGKA